MADSWTLKAEAREKFGTRASRRLRRAGKIPAVVSHKGDPPLNLALPDQDFERVLQKRVRILELEHAGRVFIQEVQYDHLGERVLHVDFKRIAQDEMLTMEVALILKGKPVGVVEENGVLDQYVKSLEIECLPENIPDKIEVDVTALKKDELLHIRDVSAPAGVRFLQDPDLVLATVTEHKVEEVTPAEVATPGPAEPEVIKKEKPEEEPEEK